MSNTDILPTFHGVTEAATTAIGRVRLTEGGNTVKACNSIISHSASFDVSRLPLMATPKWLRMEYERVRYPEKYLLSSRDREFASCSLQRRVVSEPLGRAVLASIAKWSGVRGFPLLPP